MRVVVREGTGAASGVAIVVSCSDYFRLPLLLCVLCCGATSTEHIILVLCHDGLRSLGMWCEAGSRVCPLTIQRRLPKSLSLF